MPQVVERPTVRERPDLRTTPSVEPPRARFMRWLGWLLVGAMLLGGAGLIWYGIANSGEEVVATGTAPALSEIDVNASPEAIIAAGQFDPLSRRVPGPVEVAPAFEAINPHENPEIMRVPQIEPFANPRIP
ncbi:MAG: hypothetical protein U9N56_06930 [Actinomycetota bacterium]|nr:hypothetical protein [Actinomycetota bacterium]